MVGMISTIEKSSREVLTKLQSEELLKFISEKQAVVAQIKHRELFLISRQPNKFKVSLLTTSTEHHPDCDERLQCSGTTQKESHKGE